MGRNLDDVIKSLPADRQAKIAALAQQKIDDMLAHAVTLTDFRKAVGKTQAEVAKGLGINQNAVSQLEKRSDTYVSTLRRFLKSLGMTLELSVLNKNGVRIDLPNFLQWSTPAADNTDASAFAGSTPARKRTPKPAAKQSAAKPVLRKTAGKPPTSNAAAKPAAKPAAKKAAAKPAAKKASAKPTPKRSGAKTAQT